MAHQSKTDTEITTENGSSPASDAAGVVQRPQFHVLRHVEGHVWTEVYDGIQKGQCVECGRDVLKIEGSSITRRTDGVRYAYPDDNEGWCIFRCECGVVVDDNWAAE